MRIDPETCRDPDLLASEVRRLQAVIANDSVGAIGKANPDSPQPVALTNAEREAIEYAARMIDSINRGDPAHAATLFGLLKRTETVRG